MLGEQEKKEGIFSEKTNTVSDILNFEKKFMQNGKSAFNLLNSTFYKALRLIRLGFYVKASGSTYIIIKIFLWKKSIPIKWRALHLPQVLLLIVYISYEAKSSSKPQKNHFEYK